MSRAVAAGAWVLLAVLGAAMLAWTWGTWPHSFVDFGRELYVPWRLAEGDVLYRDIAWFNGPLSVYWNALLFWVFGESLSVLIVANLLDVVLLVVLLHALLLRVGDRIAAVTGCGVFLCLFAFSRFDPIGNDNYLTPYSHELTHGVMLSLLALWAFAALRHTPLRRALATGGTLGLVALTKAEPFVAATAAWACAAALEFYHDRGKQREGYPRYAVGAVFAAALVTPGLVAWGALSFAMPMGDALRGTLGAWAALAGSNVASQYFYRATLGVVDLQENASRLLQWTLAYGAVALPTTLATLRIRPVPGSRHFTSGNSLTFAGAFFAAGLVVIFAGSTLEASWTDVLRPLPFLLGALAVGSVFIAVRNVDDRSDAGLRTALLVFATLLLAKVGLRTRLDQYGFALALPGTLLVVTAAVCWLPRWIGRRGGDTGIARAAFLGVVTGAAIALLPTVSAYIDDRPVPLGADADAFLADEVSAPVLSAVLGELGAKRADETLAVLPEGVMLNYLARRVNPTGHINFMPPEMLIFGESEILAAFRENPPDWIALTHKDTREYGVGFFGRGYARDLYAWVVANYEPVEQFGDTPLKPGSRFGVALLGRRPAVSP